MQIRIKGYTFTLREPYRPGDVMLRGEAQALNGLRAENIQNNLRKLVQEATRDLEPGQLLSQEMLEQLQAELTRYDLAYQFPERSARSRLGDIELAKREVAEEFVDAQYRREGLTAEDQVREKDILAVMDLPQVVEEARARVSARRQVLAGGIEDL